MKHLSNGFLILLFLVSFSFGAGDSSLMNFQGGNYTFNFSFASNLFLGVGTRVGAMGGDLGGMMPSSEALLWNPANLAFIRGFQYQIDTNVPLMLDPGGFVDVDSEIRSAVDDGIEDMKSDDFVMADDDYPDMSIKVGTQGQMGSGSLAIQRGRYTFAAAMFQPFAFDLDLIGTGLEARIQAGEEGSALEVTMLSSVDLSLTTRLNIQGFSLGTGFFITPDWTAGVAYERYSGIAEVNGHFQVEGIMVTAGNERAFNDPEDLGGNELFSNMIGSYKGASSGFKLASTYKLNHNWGVGVVYSMKQPLELNGDMTIDQRTLPGLDLEAEGDEDILDPTDPEFDITQPTKTKQLYNPTSKQLKIDMPGSFGLGISGKLGVIGLSLNYTRFMGNVAYHYEFKRYETDVHYSQGLKLENAIRVGLDMKYIRLGFGVTTATLIDEVDDSEEDSSEMVPLPNFTLGTGFRLIGNLRTDMILIGIPSGTGKISFYYDL